MWTVILLKPDCLTRNLTGPVLAMVSEYVRVTARRTLSPTPAQVLAHYADIVPLSPELGVDVTAELHRIYIGHPVTVALGYGCDAAARLRAVIGPTDPAEAGAGTIRGCLGADTLPKARAEGRLIDNLIHTSDDAHVVARDFAIWFGVRSAALLTPPRDPGANP
jgi:nucleoside-diphosphate kinase